MARNKQPSKKGRGGARAGAGRKPTLTDDQMIIVGGECERRWKAALKRRAMERNEAKIDDRDGLRSLHRDAVSVARGSARRDRGLVELKKAVESGEVAASAAAEIAAIPDVQRREILASTLVRLGPITHDIDAEMEALGGRYQSLSLKQVKGARRRIINEVAAWALNERGWPVSARRVKASWDHFRRIEREALSDLIERIEREALSDLIDGP